MNFSKTYFTKEFTDIKTLLLQFCHCGLPAILLKERFPTSGNDIQANSSQQKGLTPGLSPESLSASGFTLLELMIVIFLVALLLGLSSFFFANNLSSTRLNAATREMSAVIRYARAHAQTNSAAQTLTIDTDTGEYELEGRGAKKLSSDISIKVLDQTSGEVLQGKQQLVFQAIGGVEARTIVLSSGKKTVNIEMDPVVGSVVIK